jgi:glycosyltransferase involved in cell wall biosynthesis
MPKVSIIIPVYGVEKYLKECIDSVLLQTLSDIEIILVDDGGKDKCPYIIDEYANKDNRIIPIHKPNGGYGHSCNVGLERATGEYVAILEPDDFIDKDMYADLYNKALETNSEIVKSSYYENYDLNNSKFLVKQPYYKDFSIPNDVFDLKEFPILLRMHPSIWSCIYKREFLNNNKIRFVEAKGAGWTDNLFQVQTLCLANKIFFIDKPYYYWRKTNLDDANDLKDISIPFKRSDEIHSWLKEQKINDIELLSYLYRREVVYLHSINRIVKKSEMSLYKKLLKEYSATLDWTIINQSTILRKREKKFLKLVTTNPERAVFYDRLKLFKSNIFKFKYNKTDKYLKIFGIRIDFK